MLWSRSYNMTRPLIIAYPDQLGIEIPSIEFHIAFGKARIKERESVLRDGDFSYRRIDPLVPPRASPTCTKGKRLCHSSWA